MINSEYAILASAIFNNNNLYKLMEFDQNIFNDNDSKKIFSVLKSCYEDSVKIDFNVVRSKLSETTKDTTSILLKLANTHPVINYDFALNDLYKKRIKDNIKFHAKDLYTSIQNNKIDYSDFVIKINELYEKINAPQLDDSITIDELSNTGLDNIFKTSNYIKTGLDSVDEIIQGFFNGQLITIAGRAKSGKTTFTLNVIQNIKIKILFFSLEMKREEIYSKILANIASVEAWKIEAKKMNDEEFKKVLIAHQNVKNKMNMKIYDRDMNIAKIKSAINKEMKKNDPPKLIAIDYLQLIRGGQGDNQVQRIGYITRDLKQLAHNYNIPIILLSQLSRGVEKDNRRPVLSDLRDSGAIEQDSDIIIFVHENSEDKRTEIIVGGNRKGKTGIIEGLNFIKEFSRFEENGYRDDKNIYK